MSEARRQTTNTILMVRPAAFGPNPETASTNAFQHSASELKPQEIQAKALEEFNEFVDKLREGGIRVLVANDTQFPAKPDAIFPNNWLSFHEDGRAVLYPMFSTSRRAERRIEILEAVREKFELDSAFDYTNEENRGRYLEGTGSMVLDRVGRVAYACRSERTHEAVLEAFCRDFGYEPLLFDAVDRDGSPIYHTNVMLSVGTDIAVICLETIADLDQRRMVAQRLEDGGRELLEINFDQMNAFAGNMLELAHNDGFARFVMSSQALYSLQVEQAEKLYERGMIINSDLATMEKYGGGSARCMICEVFLEAKN